MADYPYQMTIVMPNAVQAGPEDNVSLATWINTAQPDTVPAGLGPGLNVSGAGEPWAHWASSAATEAGMRQIADHLAELCPTTVEVPAAGWWDAATLAEKLAWVNTDLDDAMRSEFAGGVLLEDSATNTNPAALLAEMDLHPIQPSLPPHTSESVVWRVRADLGVTGDPSGTGSPPAADGDPVGYWEDLGPDKVSARQATEAERPLWKEDRINGHPSILADGTQRMATPAPLAHGIGAGAFSLYAVVRFTTLPASGEQSIVWGTLDPPYWFGIQMSGEGLVYPVTQLPGWNLTFRTPVEAGAWYYFLLTRRETDGEIRLWINAQLHPTTSGPSPLYPMADDEQRLFDNHDDTAPMDGEIAEFGIILGCVETDGEKTALDDYIYTRYSLG